MSDQYITTDDYAYKDQPLTPTIIESLILETFSGQLQKRDVMVKVILRLHLDRGGMATQVIDLPRSFKKALERLQKQGLADNPSYGYWRVTRGAGTSDVQVEVETAIAIPAPSMLSAELIIGEGEGVVYLYYFPTYRTQAEEHNNNIWPCKNAIRFCVYCRKHQPHFQNVQSLRFLSTHHHHWHGRLHFMAS